MTKFCLIVFCFWLRPPPTRPFIDTLIFVVLKIFSWYISGPSFTYVWFVVLKFQMFSYSRRYNFRLLLDGFLDVTHWSIVKFIWNFDQWCNGTWCIRLVMVFILFLKNTWNWAKKPIFWLILRGFWFKPSYALWVTPQSAAKFNFSWGYILVAYFISLTFAAVKV